MIRNIVKKLPEPMQRLIRHLYYSYFLLGVFRSWFRRLKVVVVFITSYKDRKKLRHLLLKNRNSKGLYVQVPVIPWNQKLFQRPQQMACAMASLGYLVIYFTVIEEEIFCEEVSKGVYVTNQYWLLNDIEDAIVSVYLNYPPGYLDQYLNPKFFKNNKVFCEYVDHIDQDIWGSYLVSVMNSRFEKLNIQGYKCLEATSQQLYNELQQKFPQYPTILIENGVNPSHYNSPEVHVWNGPIDEKIAEALAQKKKIIGYFGAIAPWIWDEIIVDLAKARPDCFILLIGPTYGDRSDFNEESNIAAIGSVDYKFLPFYAKHFDVSIIPFRLGDIAKTTSPLKLFEYFAIGKPVVVTSDLVECTKYEGVFAASSSEEFIEAIDKAIIAGDTGEYSDLYQNYALENSWENRCKKLIEALK